VKAPPELPGAAEQQQSHHPPADEARPLEGVRVLVVDDQRDARELLALVLGRAGARVSTAGSAADALELFSREGAEVLVSDVGMPVEDGYTLIGRIRSMPEGLIPAVALTAYATEDDRRRAFAAGFDAHVAKPVEPTELVAVIGRLAARVGPDMAHGD
jgi:CheY-like chemotaxis protein